MDGMELRNGLQADLVNTITCVQDALVQFHTELIHNFKFFSSDLQVLYTTLQVFVGNVIESKD